MTALLRNNVQIHGEGEETLLFAHGFGCDQTVWYEVALAFIKSHKVILFDHVGSGAITAPFYDASKYSTLDGYVDDLLSVCRELQLKKITYVGHSIGAMIGILAAIREADFFKKLVLVSPSACYLNEGNYHGGFSREAVEQILVAIAADQKAWAQSLAPVVMGHSEQPELAQKLADSFCAAPAMITQQFARVTFLTDNREKVSQLQVPSVLLQSRNDVVVPDEAVQFLRDQIKDAELVQMNTIGHYPQMSSSEELIAEIRKQLE